VIVDVKSLRFGEVSRLKGASRILSLYTREYIMVTIGSDRSCAVSDGYCSKLWSEAAIYVMISDN
jgi:hypothetical protein